MIALIIAFAPRSGAHFNPVVSGALALRGDFPAARLAGYVAAQFVGALLGVLAAHAMFDLPLLQASVTVRSSPGQWLSEAVATFGLVFLVLSLDRKTAWAAPFAVGSYIAAAYWFTASTSFANPAVTLARGFTATFAGIGLANVPAFVISRLIGAGLAIAADKALRQNP
ncbi:MAG TPA: aquaporin [Burkholderiales bacterium]|nr:aquaporin [Burkholderiales bacterium]